MAQTLRLPRSDNRLPQILDEAARLFREKGYAATSMRDIAAAADMLPGSLYYHFAAKEDLLVAVYEEGVRLITDKVRTAVARHVEPWQRLEAAAVAHLEALLKTGDYALVVIRVLPQDVPKAAARLVKLRDGYDSLFAELVAALPLPPETDRQTFRLLLLGALNWSQHWFREDGRNTPRGIARSFLSCCARRRRHEHRQTRSRQAIMSTHPPKVLVTKIGLDGHDRGSRVVASYLRDAGMEVVYTPPWQDIPAVVKLAMEEDVDVIGVSSLATDHLIVPKLMQALYAAGLRDIAVIVGGIVPDADEALLLEAGVARVFHPGSALDEIAAEIGRLTRARRALNV